MKDPEKTKRTVAVVDIVFGIIKTNLSIRKWQDYVYIQCEYKSTKQK